MRDVRIAEPAEPDYTLQADVSEPSGPTATVDADPADAPTYDTDPNMSLLSTLDPETVRRLANEAAPSSPNTAILGQSPAYSPSSSTTAQSSTVAPSQKDKRILYAGAAAAVAIVGVALYMRGKKKRRR